MAEAREKGCDSVVTIGGIQSNHARATAVAACYLGLEAHLVLRTSRALVEKGQLGRSVGRAFMGCDACLLRLATAAAHSLPQTLPPPSACRPGPGGQPAG